MKRLLLIAVIIPIVLVVACSSSDNGGSTATPADNGDNTPATATPNPANATPVPNVCKPNPAPGTPDTVQIDEPAPLSRHQTTLTVSGKIAAFEAQFKIRIFDAKGNVLVGDSGKAAEGQVLSPFKEDVVLELAGEVPACLWVYEESARDGSPTNVAQVPIVVAP